MSDTPAQAPCAIRVLIIDPSDYIRHTFRLWLKRAHGIKVCGTAGDAGQAWEMLEALDPDVVTMGVDMPGMDGLAFVEKLRRGHRAAAIMVSPLSLRGADISVRALELGAADYLVTPGRPEESGWETTLTELIRKVKVAVRVRLPVPPHRAQGPGAEARVLPFDGGRSARAFVIGIGTSVGGMPGLSTLLAALPGNMPPILIVAHMPPLFTTALARQLDKRTALRVVEAKAGDKLFPGHAYVAPGGYHLRLKWDCRQPYQTVLDTTEPVCGARPAIDVLFASMAEIAGRDGIGVLLSGDGEDGAEGTQTLSQAEAVTYVLEEASCILPDMPASAKARGGVCEEIPAQEMPRTLISACEQP